jgi:hypothetical protein
MLRSEAPSWIPSALVAVTPLQHKPTGNVSKPLGRHHFTETHGFRTGPRLAEKVVPSLTVTDRRKLNGKSPIKQSDEL